VVSFARSFHSFCKRTSDHDGVCPTSEGLANVASFAHSSVGDNRYVTTGLFVKIISSRGAIDGGCHLRYSQAKDATRGAGGSRTDADQNSGDPAFKNLQGHVISDRVANNDRAIHLRAEVFEI
jgi:hypothetical protein